MTAVISVANSRGMKTRMNVSQTQGRCASSCSRNTRRVHHTSHTHHNRCPTKKSRERFLSTKWHLFDDFQSNVRRSIIPESGTLRHGSNYHDFGNSAVSDENANRNVTLKASAAALTISIQDRRDKMLEEFSNNLREEGMKNIKRCKIWLSDVTAVPRSWITGRTFAFNDFVYTAFIGLMHAGSLAAPFFFNWSALGAFFTMYFITGCLGITLSYHRQLSHKSFKTSKWLEYVLAYCGALAMQGDPSEWVSSHRHHHKHCDTPKDPHSPYEGFWWSHIGWVLDHSTTISRVGDRSNANDMAKQKFYNWLRDTYVLHMGASLLALYALGGIPFVLWGGCVRVCWVYHVTWAVNSAAHVWGNQQYNTGDLSRNNWWVGILAWGEGWHNNHHAFEYSARHGLEWYQVDMTWGVIKLLEASRLAWDIKLPSEIQKAKLRIV